MTETCSLWSNSFEQIIHKWIHDVHSSARYSSVRVNLLQHFVNINGETFFTAVSPLQLLLRLSFFTNFLQTFGSGHFDELCISSYTLSNLYSRICKLAFKSYDQSGLIQLGEYFQRRITGWDLSSQVEAKRQSTSVTFFFAWNYFRWK